MLVPKRVKHRREFRGKMRGEAKGGKEVAFGEYGLQAVDYTAKAIGVRMGSGKGAPEGWVAPVKRGKIMFEIAGVPEEVAREALRLASHKLPMKTKIVKREEMGGESNEG